MNSGQCGAREQTVCKVCKECKGRGKVTKSRRNEHNHWVYVERVCSCMVAPTVQGEIK